MLRLPPPARALVVIFAALFSGVVRAEDAPFRPPTGSVSLSGGFAARNSKFAISDELDQRVTTELGGISPTVVRLRADYFPLRWLGVEFDGTTDVFKSTLQPAKDSLPTDPLTPAVLRWNARFDSRLGVTVRYVNDLGFVLSGALGYGLSLAPVLRYPRVASPTVDAPVAASLGSHGPALRLGAALFLGRFEGSLAVTGLLGLGGYGVSSLEPQLFAGWRVLSQDTLALALGVDYGFQLELSSGPYSGAAHRVAIGLKLSWLPPPPARGVDREGGGSTTLRVQVQLPDGAPAVGASVALDGATAVTTDAKAERVLSPEPGAHTASAALAGYRTATATTQLPEGLETVVVIRLEALTGPGRLSGVVQAAATAKPVPDALVTAGEAEPVRTGSDGAFHFAAIGPGPVKVRVEAQGFNTSEEVAQVPPEGAATLDVNLEALGKGSPATVRGLVRSRTGEPLKATVVIKGLTTKVPVTPEGRFVITVPGGQYFFVITAPGYVPQTKKVVLADGDQAIFHTELQKVTK